MNRLTTAKYMWLTVRHKVFVFRAGLRTGAPIWQLVTHDTSKFSRAEAPHYGRQFFGDKGDPEGFGRAWLHHQNHNPHHWEYWIPRTGHNRGGDGGDGEPLPMPERYVREMVADWLGASRAYEGAWPASRESWPWLQKNLPGLRLHPETRASVERVLNEVFPRHALEGGRDDV